MNIKRTRSLRFKMLLALVWGAAAAFLVMVVVNVLAGLWVTNYYMDEESVEARRLHYLEELQAYVTEHGLTSSDSARIREWVQGNRWVSLTLYKDSKLLFEYETDPLPDLTDQENTSSGAGALVSPDQMEGTYPLRMKDGILLAAVDEHSYYYLNMVLRFVGGLLAGVAFCFIVLQAFRKTTRRIMHLADKVNRVGEGDLHLPVRDDGEDEISALADTVNRMRDSIVEKMEKEQEAWQANTGLITAMSHDIRTPLTVLMGYLDLLKAEKDPQKAARYVDSCRETALRLKHLSDDLFHSFLVFQNREDTAQLQSYDVTILFDQIFAERSVLLSEQGYILQTEILVSPGTCILADTGILLRIIDNIFSNALKYANSKVPIHLTLYATETHCILQTVNRERDAHFVASESTGIGLKSCEKLAAFMGGSFTWKKEKNVFLSELSLKLAKA